MITLALDTAVNGCSVAIFNTAENTVAKDCVATERGQAEILVPMISTVIEKSGLNYRDLTQINVTAGPGSFTGVRVGLATAKALALALNIPLYAFSTLHVIAAHSGITEKYLIVIDTKRGDYYGQVFEENSSIDAARIWSLAEVENFDGLVIKGKLPDIETLAKLPVDRAQAQAAPIYLREAEVSQSKKQPPKIIT